MAKIEGRKIIGLSEAARTWQFFNGRPGWDVEIWFDAYEGIVWAIPLPVSGVDGWRIFTCGNYRVWYLVPRDVPSDYKGKIAYLKDAVARALYRYEGCCEILYGE